MSAKPDGRVHATLRDLVRLRSLASGFSFLPRQPVYSELAGRNASRLRGRGLDFDELRRYLPGDDVRSMDWKATARTRRPHVRVYSEERDRPMLLVVDQRASMFFGSVNRTKSVTAAHAAAISAWRGLSQGDRVGGVVFGDDRLVRLRPQRSDRAVMGLLSEIVRMNRTLDSDSGGRDRPRQLDAALRSARELAGHDHLVVLISDFAGAGDESARLATQISQHNDVIAVFVHDPMELELPRAGRLAFRAARGQIEVDTDDALVRERFAEEIAQRRRSARRLLLSREIPVIPLDTVEDIPAQVRRVLGTRGR